MSGLVKRSLSIAGHRTSLALEPEYWDALEFIAGERDLSVAALICEIDGERDAEGTLSSAVRVYALTRFRDAQSR